MAALPRERAPTARDWERISRAVKGRIDLEIARLNKVRTDLAGCIGCGCRSLKRCALYHADDRWGASGAWPRVLR